MRVFVTGAAGFIGSRLSKALLERGDEVVGFDNINDYYAPVHKERHLADLKDASGFTFVKGDLCDAPLLLELFRRHKPQAVAHLGAMAAVRYSVLHPLMYGEINVQGSMNLMDAARQIAAEMPGPRMVLASTGSAYGSTTPAPFREDAAADRPLAPYPASKRAMEIIAHSYHHMWKLPMTILRFFNVYGPHGRPDMMPWQWTLDILSGATLNLYNGGHLKRDWTYIDDIVTGFIAALDAGLPYEVINLGCGNPVENLDFVHVLEKLLKRQAIIKDVPSPASEPLITFADISKAQRLLGYSPKVNVDEGLARFIDWMRAEKIIQ